MFLAQLCSSKLAKDQSFVIFCISSLSMLIAWKSQVLSCGYKKQLDPESSYEGHEKQSCDSGEILFHAEQRDFY